MSARHRRRQRKSHPNWPLRLIGIGLAVSFLFAAVILPGWKFRMDSSAFENERWDVFWSSSLTCVMHWFGLLWVSFFGACLGSFLNVVAYRVPNGLTLFGSSRCPYCFVSIESRFNLPIAGWFALRGRCKACRLPISPRYFIVEIIAGSLLVWIYLMQVLSDGSNLPGNKAYEIETLFRILVSGKYDELRLGNWSLVRITVIHCIAGYALLTAALMRLDRLRIPAVWLAAHLLAIYGLMVAWPADHDMILRGEVSILLDLTRFAQFLPGAIVGVLFGYAIDRSWPGSEPRPGMTAGAILVGLTAGVSAAISIFLIFLLIQVVWRLIRLQFLIDHSLFTLLLAFLLQLGFWEVMEQGGYWPGTNTPALGLGGIWLLEMTVAILMSRSRSESNRLAGESPESDSQAPSEADLKELAAGSDGSGSADTTPDHSDSGER